MGKPIRNITIVGGGTTGWLAATVLNHRLQWGFAHPDGVNITVIESPHVPIIGVGEATIPAIRQTLEMLEIDEAEFIARTNATFKLGVRFDNWHKPGGGRPESFFHPFTGGVQVAGRNPAASLLAYGLPEGVDADPQLSNLVGHGVAAAAAAKSPKRPSDGAYRGALGYSYHVDAALFAAFLQEVAMARGVRHVSDTVQGVERNERGHIAALQLADSGRHEVELVIDCSGFRGLLINQALEEPFESFSDYLLNDRAAVVQIKHREGDPLLPTTASTALGSGWRFGIPLQSRIGTGYIHSSNFISEQDAIDELVRSLNGAERITEPRIVPMRVGRTRRSWVGNCVALGLAGGFLEPLESTAIQFVDFACRRLLQCMPSSDFEPAPIDKFNKQMALIYDDVLDFLGLHFTLGDRDDTPYWRAQQHEAKRSDRLEECLALWRGGLPDVYDPRGSDIFTFWSVAAVLFGKGFYSGPVAAGSDLLPRPMWDRYVHNFLNLREGVLATLPDHAAALKGIGERAVTGATVAKSARPDSVPRIGFALGPPVPVMTPGGIAAAG
ncbi:tryptophan 7-halogenase [Sphingomonas sp. AOB5]|uniref:tryptophan halogenase family protein n=1 Tax=Sphingomonas sp. AOB5 TaxID=3034017 RepID=UPI0023F7BABF|nr:tryptophan halogenase family protein [Sphingomonas sp. AOB5]MDF7776835.1 tryptophan 7-halogenase [Sphingomonas sp. AOB5]